MKFGVCILVGGKSSRMNFQPKADLVYKGKTFLQQLSKEFSSYPKKYISINSLQKYQIPDYSIIVDEYKDIGPISGIVSTFHQSDIDTLFVCSCDMPFIKKELVEFLLEKLDSYDGIFLEDENHTYLTAGIYTRKMLPIMESQIQKGNYQLYRCIKLSNVKLLQVKDWYINPFLLRNINTFKDYSDLEG